MYILYFCFVKIISSILFPELLFVMYFNLVLCSVVTTTYVLIYVLYAPCKSSLWLNGSLKLSHSLILSRQYYKTASLTFHRVLQFSRSTLGSSGPCQQLT